jgi:tripartite-type tricarboxylate transporter receptor subunit TctC
MFAKELLVRGIVGASAVAALIVATQSAHAQTYPTRPIQLIVPFAAGTTTDLLARQVSEKMSELIGQRFVIENKAGAGGTIGTEFAAKGATDGYTLLFGTGQTQAVNVSLYKNFKIDPMTEFVPVAKIASQPLVLVVHPGVTAKTVSELAAQVRREPEKFTFASTGGGSSPHLAGSMFNRAADLKLLHVPYNNAQVFPDLLSGRTSMMFYPYMPLKGYIEQKQLIPLAVTGSVRLPELPDVPTMVESGYADLVIAPWYAVYAPAKTPSAVVDLVSDVVKRALADADLRGRLANTGTTIDYQGPADLATFNASEIKRFKTIVEMSGASVN